MPIYEFSCSTCGRPFEELVQSAEAVNRVLCPKCGSHHIQRKISLFASKSSASSASSNAASASCSTGST